MHVHTAYAKTIALHIFVFLAQRHSACQGFQVEYSACAQQHAEAGRSLLHLSRVKARVHTCRHPGAA